jgi:hypothetical protein
LLTHPHMTWSFILMLIGPTVLTPGDLPLVIVLILVAT